MDHEIEDDIDVECSRSKNTEPVHLKKKRLMQNGANSSNRWIESFEVADLNDALDDAAPERSTRLPVGGLR